MRNNSIREILTLSWGFNFADGPFQNILWISRMRLDQIFSQTGGWNKKNKNQLRNNNDFYVWKISQGLRFVSNKDCIHFSNFFSRGFNFADGQLQIFRRDLISRFFLNPLNPQNLIHRVGFLVPSRPKCWLQMFMT